MTLDQQGTVMMPNEGDVVTVVGDVITFKALGQNTQGQYALFEIACEPEGGTPPHIHGREDEAFYVLEGEVSFRLDDETIVATPGTFLHSPKGQKHSFKNTGAMRSQMLCWVTPAGLEMFFAEIGSPVPDPLNPPAPDQAAIDKLLEAAPKYGLTILPPEA